MKAVPKKPGPIGMVDVERLCEEGVVRTNGPLSDIVQGVLSL